MKISRRNFVFSVLLLALLAQMAMTVNSYPGIAGGSMPCYLCHNTPMDTMYDADTMANVQGIVDGNKSEAFWGPAGQVLYIPVGIGHDFEFIRTEVAQNSTHLFMLFRIHDDDRLVEGADTFAYQDADKFSIIWNINATSTGLNWKTMSTTLSEGEAVDMWTWHPTTADNYDSLANDNVTKFFEGNVQDWTYSPTLVEDETNEVVSGAMYEQSSRTGEMDLYIEFARPLVTDDVNDVQFDKTGYYDFSIAYWNTTAGAKHWVSFHNWVYIHNGPVAYETTVTDTVYNTVNTTFTETKTDTPFMFSFVFMGILTAVTGVVLLRRRK